MDAAPQLACAKARSLLFVPGNRPERFETAARCGADAVIIDLEDSVPLSDKAAARASLAQRWPDLRELGVAMLVRTNALDNDAGQEDLACLSRLEGLTAVMLPKVETVESLAQVRARIADTPILPLIESAAGLEALPRLAAAPGVLRLVLGHIDFMTDTGIACDDDESELTPLRFAMAMVTRRHRLAPAIDGVTVRIDDMDRLRADTHRALRFGFGAKLCIHPRQVAVVHETFAPSSEEMAWAHRVVAADAASGGAAVQLDGRMIDLPVVLRARLTLDRAGASKGAGQ